MHTLSSCLFNPRGWRRELRKAVGLTAILALLLVFVGNGQTVHAASLTVTTTNDELNTDGDCSLREAIQAANTDTVVDACFAGSGVDTITVPAGTYVLSLTGVNEDANQTGDFDITSDVTIQGDGAATTVIDGAGLDRVLHILAFAGHVQISGVTIRNGTYLFAGGISNQDGLTLLNIILEGNSAEFGSGIFNHGGTLEIYNSIIRSNDAIVKGGIFNGTLGTVIIKDSTISENTGSHGGLSNEGTVTIIHSTWSGNVTTDLGGAIGNAGFMTIEDSSFSNNAAGRGSAIYNWGELNVTGSNFIGNIGNLGGSTISNAPSGEIAIEKSTFSENTCVGVENEGSMSITGSSYTKNTWGAFVNMQTGVAIIEASIFSENRAPDGGAINNFRGDLTLTHVTVKNNTGGYGGGIFNAGALSITHSKIQENSATESGGGIHNREGGVITVDKSMIAQNSALFGGGIDNSIGPNAGTITLKHSHVIGNTARWGGGIWNETGSVTLDSSELNHNTARGGGGIFNVDSFFLMNSVVAGNKATGGPGYGGGILNQGVVTLTKSQIHGNQPDNCVGCGP